MLGFDNNLSDFLARLRQSAISDVPVPFFLRDIARLLQEFAACDAVEIWVERGSRCVRCRAKRQPPGAFRLDSRTNNDSDQSPLLACSHEQPLVDWLCRAVIEQRENGLLLANGSFYCDSLRETLRNLPARVTKKLPVAKPTQQGAIAVLPLSTGGSIFGLLVLQNRSKRPILGGDSQTFAEIAMALAYTLSSQFAHAALHERVKELTCLYQLSLLVENPETSLDDVVRGVVQLLPPAWQYPDITAARIDLDGRHFDTDDYPANPAHQQTAAIVVHGVPRGHVRVAYRTRCFDLDEGPFLREERALIDAIARQLAQVVEQRHAAAEKLRLQEQLLHADRLATIGVLAAGVAHEMNEPLGNILAFAQLAEKQQAIPRQVADDLGKIVKASLHAREIIKKLMLFARQTPPQKRLTDLNKLVDDGLYFLESRCANNGITIERQLARGLPKITVDPGQINQVLVNLIVNAIQAMPHGGVLKIGTRRNVRSVSITIEDSGVGMNCEVLDKIFVPFFTTKDVDQGTGLGLPVAHGIVTAHGGRIEVITRPHEGSRFEVILPRPHQTAKKGTVHDR